jgi:hypothetical protein
VAEPSETHLVLGRFDTDGNGGIDEAELGAGLKEVLGYNALETVEVAELLREADLDKNGVIDAEEFETMVALVLEKASRTPTPRDTPRPQADRTGSPGECCKAPAPYAACCFAALKRRGVMTS